MGTNMDKDKAGQVVREITDDQKLKDRSETQEADGDISEGIRGVENSETNFAEEVRDTMEDATDQSEELFENATDAAQRK